MQGLAKSVAIATALFFVIMWAWRQDVVSAAFSAVIFAMAYAAVKVALVLFRSGQD